MRGSGWIESSMPISAYPADPRPARAAAAVAATPASLLPARDEGALALAAGRMLESMHMLLQGGVRCAAHDAVLGAAGLASPVADAQRVNRLAADWLAFARAQRLFTASVELLPLLCSLAHTVRQERHQRLDVSVRVTRDCPPCLVDREALEAALLHLVANACEAMRLGGRLLFLAESCRSSDGSSCIELSVSDSGSGMTPEVAALATVPFFTTKTEDRWAGLGLAAVEGFSCQSGGRLALQSAPGGGTVVTLRLPEFADGRCAAGGA
jgi:signal transduction histidine kinase